MVSNALNKQNQSKQKKKKSRGSKGRNNNLQLNSGQNSSGLPMNFFKVLPGSTPGGVRVRGRELCVTVQAYGDARFHCLTKNLTPNLLPRLNAYSTIYEMYIFHSAKPIFQSSQPTTAAGISAISIEYDVSDTFPTNLEQMMRNISSSMSNIYADNGCLVDKRLSRLPKYFNTVNSSSTDANTVQAKINYATEGWTDPDVTANIFPVGYLLIEYDVEFFTPQ
jgi:hypothetical protein